MLPTLPSPQRRCVSPAILVIVSVLMLGAPLAAAANVRPFLAAGATVPIHWGTIERGNVLGVGLEFERSPRVSHVAELEVHRLSGDPAGPVFFPTQGPTPASRWTDATAWAGQFGLRVHLLVSRSLRPFVQAGFGVRVGSARAESWVAPMSGSGVPGTSSRPDGPNAHLRLGLTTAGFGGAGLFADVTAEALLRNPRDYALAPVRLGITLP